MGAVFEEKAVVEPAKPRQNKAESIRLQASSSWVSSGLPSPAAHSARATPCAALAALVDRQFKPFDQTLDLFTGNRMGGFCL